MHLVLSLLSACDWERQRLGLESSSCGGEHAGPLLVGSNMFWFQQDIGHNNALPFAGAIEYLVVGLNRKKLVVGREHVAIFDHVLILATYFWTTYISGTFHPYLSYIIMIDIAGNDFTGMTSPT